MIALIDYGMGNLRSVEKALERCGGQVKIVTTPSGILSADKVVLPGVGAMRDAMNRINSTGIADAVRETITAGRPLLGICLGLQMLLDRSFEYGEFKGLGIIPGDVVRFDFSGTSNSGLKIPHMGWNSINFNADCPLLAGIDQGAYVYFVHSYYVCPKDQSVTAATCNYGVDFTAAIWRDNLFATQFHPEKSQAVGLKILENFVKKI
ncbi:MAG TPA: imidazole glycerol phosphate synthase subunit HisH [Phycisphaerae bacterium]|nr:imidazole glycerol phosphate synthase subunit HisH [Phycisphaerae bacterium]HPS52597.1 imidazole glycerol phosphate synthase subunit HisH [Phycisphaerae bacterium]